MNDFQFIDFTPTPHDKYGMLGIATVRLYGKIVQRYKLTLSKNGAEFFCAPSFSIEENGQKKYLPAFFLDSRFDEEALIKFIRYNVDTYRRPPNTSIPHTPQPTQKKYDQMDFLNTNTQVSDNLPNIPDDLPF